MRVTKIIKTETAHRLYGYDGACANIHGHSYKFEVTLEGPIGSLGLTIDFKDIKKKVGNLINNMYDHRIVLNQDDPLVADLRNGAGLVDITIMDGNPTAENMARAIWDHIDPMFPGMLVSIKVWETETSFAEVMA